MTIRNTAGLTMDQLQHELNKGAKFVVFEYTISILILTFKRPSDIYFIRSGETLWRQRMGFTLLSLIFGWWSPWGLIYTPMTVVTNLRGGKNVTREVVYALTSELEMA